MSLNVFKEKFKALHLRSALVTFSKIDGVGKID